jgi:hypothetical protein
LFNFVWFYQLVVSCCRFLSDFASFCQVLSVYVRFCQMLSDFAWFCRSLSDFVRFCQMLSVFKRCCQFLSVVVSVCQLLSMCCMILNYFSVFFKFMLLCFKNKCGCHMLLSSSPLLDQCLSNVNVCQCVLIVVGPLWSNTGWSNMGAMVSHTTSISCRPPRTPHRPSNEKKTLAWRPLRKE